VGRLGGSESSDDSSDSGGLIDVIESDCENHIDVSDSDDEDGRDGSAGDVNRTSTLATTKILTPADFALLNDLRIQATSKAVENGGGSSARLNG